MWTAIIVIVLAIVFMSMAWYFLYLMLASFLRDVGEDADSVINEILKQDNMYNN